MNFFRVLFMVHIGQNFGFYMILLFVFAWNYFLLPNPIPYYLYHFIEPIGINQFALLLFSKILFVVLLSLLFVYPNKEAVKAFEFEQDKHKKMMFWICQSISFVLVIFIGQVYEGVAMLLF